MTILELCRNTSFWILDTIRGGIVKDEMQLLQNCETKNEEYISEYANNAIQKLLDYAADKTSFYMPYKGKPFSEWPVISKFHLKNNPDEFISRDYKKADLIPMATSGSTGTPLVVYHDGKKKKAVYAEVLHYNGKVNYKIGKKMIYLRSIVSEVSKSKFQQFVQNITLVDCYDMSDKGIEDKIHLIAQKTKNCGAMLISYASTLDALRDYFARNGNEIAKDCNVYGVISGSEMLFDDTRAAIEDAFRCKCVSRYANEEGGFLGQDGIDNNVFLTNRGHFFYEIVNMESDEPVENGEVGRIVITDLKNYSMPLIRYDTGDVGSLSSRVINGVERQVIDNFGGRKVDVIFNSHGDRISPHSVTNNMWKFPEINQYQLIQNEAKRFTLKLNIHKDSFNREAELVEVIKEIIGREAELNIEYVSEIPVMNSGKRKYIVNDES